MKKISKILFLFTISFVFIINNSTAQNKMNVRSYLNALPDEYIICSLDEDYLTKTEDINNGYIAYFVPYMTKEPFFQITLFKNSKKEDFIVIHTAKAGCQVFFDCANIERETKFLKYENNKWVNLDTNFLNMELLLM